MQKLKTNVYSYQSITNIYWKCKTCEDFHIYKLWTIYTLQTSMMKIKINWKVCYNISLTVIDNADFDKPLVHSS